MKYSIEKQPMRRKWYMPKYWQGLDWIFVVLLLVAAIWNTYLFIFIF